MAQTPISTDRQCAALKCPEGTFKVRVAVKNLGFGGLSLEARSDRQTKAWLYRFRMGEKSCEMTLGNYPALSLTNARTKHKEAVELVKQGIDPRHFKAALKAENEAVITMQELHERWITHQKRANEVKPSTIQEHAYRWQHYLQSRLGKIRLDHLTRAHLANALDEMRESTKEQTRKAMSTLNGMIDYALVRGLIEENPMRLLKPKDFSASTPEGRSRWLPFAELTLLWQALETKSMTGRGVAATSTLSLSMVGVIKTVVLTGCRREEAVAMRWDELDIEQGIWTLPPNRTKNGAGHTIFLSELMITLLEEIKVLNGQSPFVFSSPRTYDKPLTGHAVSRAIKRLQEPKTATQPEGLLYNKMQPFTLHDLRRTCATHWADTLQADTRVVELMLNHLPTDKLVRTYQRGKQIEQQKAIWLKWGDTITNLVNKSI
ncbi:MAG: site-specific integrase [Pseudomonadales bacterium]|nr:site-specific integrase [Pseudomonadales bacterium]